ncbi:MAG: lysophospholipid acyltransferase family protein [Phycisphaerae bacterium]|nr:lysophospholipid acyltransferase family protein [Phycisphaerae bacterium]
MSDATPKPSASALVPATPSARVRAGFAWYAERLLRRSFATVRLAQGSDDALRALAGTTGGPLLLAYSHASWWDPIVGTFLWRRHFADRPAFAPMDARELARFQFMRKLGLFGIDPDDPASIEAMSAYLVAETKAAPRAVIAITPQGRFTDPRDELVVRPGAAALASHLGVQAAASVAIEYAFWNERLPEVFVRVERVARPTAPSTASWHRSIVAAMRGNAESLAALVRARDASAFQAALGKGAGAHPVYDLWLRLRGKGRSIDTSHRHAAPADLATADGGSR